MARTEGVPLFVEELTKAVLESGLLTDAGERYEMSGPLPPFAIPTTLHDSLMGRLDRLGSVKEIAQIGAVIGREFSHELLVAVADRPEAELQAALDQLVNSELVFRRGPPSDSTYSFKHTLVQDTAYQSLLKSKRQQLHASIAEALEQRFPEIGQTQPEVLAQHSTEAGLGEPAIPYLRRAGELAAGRSANVEAIAHLRKGLDLIGSLANASDRPEKELDRLEKELILRLAMGGPLIAIRGHAAPEVEQNYSRALVLCDHLGRSGEEQFPVLRGLWNYHLVRGELQRAYDLAERLDALAKDRGGARRALAQRALGSTLFFFGRFADANDALDDGVALDDSVVAANDARADLVLNPESAGVVCRVLSGRALWFLGFPDSALAKVEDGLVLGRRLAHATSLAFALNIAAALHALRREFHSARKHAEEAIAFATEHDLPLWLAFGQMCRGFALAALGRQTEGIAQLRTGLGNWNRVDAHLLDTQWLGFIAEAQIQAGNFDHALTGLDRATETAAATGECHYQAELFRLRGVVLAQTGEHAEATAWLQRAIDTAKSQQAKSLELRAATSLARLWRDQGSVDAAHELLAPVYGWFTEGFDTADLRNAKALLDELA